MTLALALLLCMFLGTHGFNTQLVIEPQPNFDTEKFAGEWYRIGLADESLLFAMFKNQLKVSKGLLVPDAMGNVNLTMWTMRPYGCSISVYSYEKTDVPGEFTYFSKRHKITKDITIVETNYTDYSMVLKYKNMDKEYTQVALYGRSSILRPDLIQIFRSFALSLGFSEEAIVTPTDVDPCPILEPSQLWIQTLGYIYSVLLNIWGRVFVLTQTIIGEMQHYNASSM
ncbi:lipocalin-15 isoform X1 [Sinocyclocheilus rhinocerous]|uniref:lipocalin-15 isoform X1 n=1 Tax=Sinocyclocheilus rhinocerous TaxID=307959 RepID=UPI0007B7BBAA|nr:PREDICTED: prostaglandin-H2 D-isomerase-like isoform X1 [Sinocyclocheilus rhinocerous]